MVSAFAYATSRGSAKEVAGMSMRNMLIAEAGRIGCAVRCGYALASGPGPTHWKNMTESDGGHCLRTVLSNQIVYDLGDKGDWKRCKLESEALWATLDIMGIPHWRSLSGGRGTHTEIFLADTAIDRKTFHLRLRGLVYEVSGVLLQPDERFIAAPAGNVQLREFGNHKRIGGFCKTLYPFDELCDSLAESYARVGATIYPSEVPRADSPWGPLSAVVPSGTDTSEPGSTGIGRSHAAQLFETLRNTGELGHLDRFRLLMYLLRSGRSDDDIQAVFAHAKNYERGKTEYYIRQARGKYL